MLLCFVLLCNIQPRMVQCVSCSVSLISCSLFFFCLSNTLAFLRSLSEWFSRIPPLSKMDLSGCLLIIRFRPMSSGMHWKNEITSAFSRFLTRPTLSSCQDPSPPLYYFLFPTFEDLIKVSYMLKLPLFYLCTTICLACPFPPLPSAQFGEHTCMLYVALNITLPRSPSSMCGPAYPYTCLITFPLFHGSSKPDP